MMRCTKIVICTIFIFLSISGAAYGVFVSLWRAHVAVTIGPAPPKDKPPTCVLKLQKDGSEISVINIGEFFDIYVGDSTDDVCIRYVRFSSDDVQDSDPTGRWTEWYEWSISSRDWDAYSKIKRWAFATPGYKEVWAEVKDDIGQTTRGHATIFVPYPALPVLTSPLVITPEKDFYVVGNSVTGEFTIKNIGDKAITLDVLTIGGRLNGWSIVDFPHVLVTLGPGASYRYEGSITFDQHGSYRFFIAYHILNPTQEEKPLLDENNWNTCVQLGEGLTHTDRVKNIVVFEDEAVAEEISELKEQINRLRRHRSNYPPYLCDPDSFWSGVAVVWMDVTSFGRLTQKYDELYNAGIEYDSLAYNALISADRLLDKALLEGDQKYVEGTKWLLQEYYRYRKLSDTCFTAALEVFDNHLTTAEKLALSIFLTAIKLEVSIVYPPAAPFVDKIVEGIKFGYTVKTEGWTPAIRDLAVELTSKLLFKVNFKSLGLYNLEEYVNRFASKPLELFMNEEFVKEIQDTLEEIIQKRVLVEIGVEMLEEDIKIIVDEIINNFKSLMDFIEAKIKSPIEIRVLDSKGQITGLVNGRVRHEIPMSYYNNGTVIIFFTEDSYLYEVAGQEEGIYSLEIASTRDGETTTFIATNIPISTKAIHQYTVDWAALSFGGDGVAVCVDSDGDGVIEYMFTSDSELYNREFIFPAKAIFTFNVSWESANYPVTIFGSNSSITNFNFNQSLKQINFQLLGEMGVSGCCNVSIPKTLLRGPWAVQINGTNWGFTLTENETHSFIYIIYTFSSVYEVTIEGTWVVPEFSPFTIIALLMMPSLIAVAFAKKSLRKFRKIRNFPKL